MATIPSFVMMLREIRGTGEVGATVPTDGIYWDLTINTARGGNAGLYGDIQAMHAAVSTASTPVNTAKVAAEAAQSAAEVAATASGVARDGSETAATTATTKEALISPYYTAINTINSIGSVPIEAVANIHAEIVTVTGIQSNVTTVAANYLNVNKVADIDANVTVVANNSTNVTLVASIDDRITLVADDINKVNNVGAYILDVIAVSDGVTDGSIALVSTNIADVQRVGTVDNIAVMATLTPSVITDMDTITTGTVIADMATITDPANLPKILAAEAGGDKAETASGSIDTFLGIGGGLELANTAATKAQAWSETAGSTEVEQYAFSSKQWAEADNVLEIASGVTRKSAKKYAEDAAASAAEAAETTFTALADADPIDGVTNLNKVVYVDANNHLSYLTMDPAAVQLGYVENYSSATMPVAGLIATAIGERVEIAGTEYQWIKTIVSNLSESGSVLTLTDRYLNVALSQLGAHVTAAKEVTSYELVQKMIADETIGTY